MNAERARLKRLQRLEAVRAVAKRTAAQDAARAESTLAQLEALAERTRRLASGYAHSDVATDGGGLRQSGRFAEGLRQICEGTARDVADARELADRHLAALAAAERRRAAAQDRASDQQRRIAAVPQAPALGGRRVAGTKLD